MVHRLTIFKPHDCRIFSVPKLHSVSIGCGFEGDNRFKTSSTDLAVCISSMYDLDP